MSDHPNYYRILGLDPSMDDWPAIESRIEELQRQYNRVRADALKAQQREAEAFKIMLPDIRKVMQDPKLRRDETEARRRELKEEQQKLDAYLRILQKRGGYTKKDVKAIASQLSGFDESVIESKIKKLGLKLGTAETTKSQKRVDRPMLPDAEGQSIAADLIGLQLVSLYAFLGKEFSPRSSVSTLETAYEAQKQVVAELVRGTPEHKVRSAILGHVQKHLLNEKSREKYDNYLADQALRTLDTYIKVRGGDEKVITEDALNDIIREGQVPGVTAERIREYVEQWVVRTKGWTLSVGSKVLAESLLTCGFCGTLALDASQPKCRDCGKPLTITCPKPGCVQMVSTQDRCCVKCGCATGDAPHVAKLLEQAEMDVAYEKYQEEERRLREILNIWPDYCDATELLGQIEQAQLRKQAETQAALDRLRFEQQAERERQERQERKTRDHRAALDGKLALISEARECLGRDQRRADAIIKRLKAEHSDDVEVVRIEIEWMTKEKKKQAEAEILQLCSTRHFFEAYHKLIVFEADEIPGVRNQIRDARARAQSHVREGDSFLAGGNVAEAREEYKAALLISADEPDAISGLTVVPRDIAVHSPSVRMNVKSDSDLEEQSRSRNRNVMLALTGIVIIVFLITSYLLLSASDLSELRTIQELAIIGSPDVAQTRLLAFVAGDSARRALAIEYLSNVAHGYVQVAKRREHSKSDAEDTARSLAALSDAARIYALAEQIGYSDGRSNRADCAFLQAQLYEEAEEFRNATDFYSQAALFYDLAAVAYRKKGETAAAEDCEYNGAACRTLQEKIKSAEAI